MFFSPLNRLFSSPSSRNIFSFLAFSVLLIYSSGCTSNKEDKTALGKKHYADALKFSSLNDNSKMFESLKEAVRLDPLEPNYHLTLGRNFFKEGQLDNAEQEFLQTIQIDSDYSEAYRQLGRLYMHRGEFDKAVDYLKTGLTKPKVNSPQQIQNWIAISYYALGKVDKAEEQWLNSLSVRENENIRLNLALAYRDQEKFDLAMDSLKKAVLHNPAFPLAHYHLGLLYLKNKKLRLAEDHFRKVVKLSPKSVQARASREYLSIIPN